MSRLQWRPLVPYVAFVIVALGALNFIWFMTETAPLNLIPSDGRVHDGHYFLWSKIRGGFVEVGEAQFRWLPLHETSVFLSWPFVMIAGGVLVFRIFGGQIRGDLETDADAERIAAVRASGASIASRRVAGSIGSVWFSRPLLRVDVHPAGIVVKPALMSERAILASEIERVTPGGGLGPTSSAARGPLLGLAVRGVPDRLWPRGPFLEIDHTGRGMATPVRLERPGWDTAQAILAIAGEANSVAAGLTPAAQRDRIDRGRRSFDGLPRPVVWGGLVLSAVVTVSLFAYGLTFAIPQLGPFGVVWTAGLVAITAFNVRRYLLNRRR